MQNLESGSLLLYNLWPYKQINKQLTWNLKLGTIENVSIVGMQFHVSIFTRRKAKNNKGERDKERAKAARRVISPYSLHTDTACNRVCRCPGLQSEHTGLRQCSQIVYPSGPHHWPAWILTKAKTACRCVSTSSLRFHDPRCRAKIENNVSLDLVWKWRGADEKFKTTKYII